MLIHADCDLTVNYEHSVMLHECRTHAGYPSELYTQVSTARFQKGHNQYDFQNDYIVPVKVFLKKHVVDFTFAAVTKASIVIISLPMDVIEGLKVIPPMYMVPLPESKLNLTSAALWCICPMVSCTEATLAVTCCSSHSLSAYLCSCHQCRRYDRSKRFDYQKRRRDAAAALGGHQPRPSVQGLSTKGRAQAPGAKSYFNNLYNRTTSSMPTYAKLKVNRPPKDATPLISAPNKGSDAPKELTSEHADTPQTANPTAIQSHIEAEEEKLDDDDDKDDGLLRLSEASDVSLGGFLREASQKHIFPSAATIALLAEAAETPLPAESAKQSVDDLTLLPPIIESKTNDAEEEQEVATRVEEPAALTDATLPQRRSFLSLDDINGSIRDNTHRIVEVFRAASPPKDKKKRRSSSQLHLTNIYVSEPVSECSSNASSRSASPAKSSSSKSYMSIDEKRDIVLKKSFYRYSNGSIHSSPGGSRMSPQRSGKASYVRSSQTSSVGGEQVGGGDAARPLRCTQDSDPYPDEFKVDGSMHDGDDGADDLSVNGSRDHFDDYVPITHEELGTEVNSHLALSVGSGSALAPVVGITAVPAPVAVVGPVEEVGHNSEGKEPEDGLDYIPG